MMFEPGDAKLHARLNAYRTVGGLDIMIDTLESVLQVVDPDITPMDYCPSFEKDLAIAYERLDQALQKLRDARANLYVRAEAE